MDKLQQLLEDWGYGSKEELAEASLFDNSSPGICMNEGCDYSTEVEPDNDQGWCENCGTNTVKSGMMLAGYI